MAKKSEFGRPGGWIQDTTLYVPPTTSVSEVPLKPEWAAVSSESLAKSLGIKDALTLPETERS